MYAGKVKKAYEAKNLELLLKFKIMVAAFNRRIAGKTLSITK